MKTRNMKTLFRIMTLFLTIFCFAGCDDEQNNIDVLRITNDDDDEEVLATLDVTAANLDGTWKLVEWNGAPLQEGSYCYITFSRKDKTYKMYDKFSSMYSNLKTGSFEIEKEKDLGYIISGNYDFGNGEWANSYIVTNLLATSMIWTIKDTPSDVQKFERCDKVPEEIENEVRDF